MNFFHNKTIQLFSKKQYIRLVKSLLYNIWFLCQEEKYNQIIFGDSEHAEKHPSCVPD